MSDCTALVLGTGQVGTFACRSLEAAGVRVIGADRAPASGFFARFSQTREAELTELDALDTEAVARLIESRGVDTVVLAAGLVGNSCDRDPEGAWRVNVQGAASVGAAALAGGAARLVFISTLGVYGRPKADRIDESFPMDPRSEYGRTKAAAEAELARLSEQGIEVAVIRPCGLYGPLRLGGGSHSARFIEGVLMSAARTSRVVIAAGPSSDDQYLYVKDLGDAIARVALAVNGPRHRVFNVAPPEKTTAVELADAIRDVVPGASVEIREEPAVPDRMPPLDASRIHDELGFAPRFTLSAGLGDYVREAGWLS